MRKEMEVLPQPLDQDNEHEHDGGVQHGAEEDADEAQHQEGTHSVVNEDVVLDSYAFYEAGQAFEGMEEGTVRSEHGEDGDALQLLGDCDDNEGMLEQKLHQGLLGNEASCLLAH